MAHILPKVGPTYLRETDAMNVLRAMAAHGIDESCAEVTRMVFGKHNQHLGLCDEPIRFTGVEGRPEIIREGLIDLDLDGENERVEAGHCGSCGCSWTFDRLLSGAWEEMDNIECGGGSPYELRGSSKLVNGYKVLCLKDTPRFYWSTTKPFGPSVRAGYVASVE